MIATAPPRESAQLPGRSATIPIVVMVALVSAAAVVITVVGVHSFDTAVLGTFAVACMVCAAVLVVYRPVVFPFAAYLFMVPFDNVLQTGGGTLTKFLAIASVAVVLLTILGQRRAVVPPLAVAAWGAFFAWSLCSVAWSENIAAGSQSLSQVLQLFAAYCVFAILRVRAVEVRTLMAAVVGGGFVAACYGLWMFHNGHVSVNDSAARLNIAFSSNSFINADHFAGALVFPVAIALVWTVRGRPWVKALAWVIVLVLLSAIFASATRGSLIAVAAMLCYLIVVERQRLQLIILAATGVLTSFLIPGVWLRFVDPTQGDAGGRYGIWAVAWAAFKQHPLLGVGTGDFRVAYSDVYLTVFQRGSFHAWAEDSHNLIASTAVELGVIGLVLMLAAWIFQFRTVAHIPRSSSLSDLRTTVEAATIGLFIVAMTVDLMWYKYLWILFMMSVLVRNAWKSRPV